MNRNKKIMKALRSGIIMMLCLVMTGTALADSGVYTATGIDESAIDLGGTEKLDLVGVTVEKPSGDASSVDASSFRGVNAAVRVYDKAELTLRDSVVTADASNATGVFAYDGGIIHLENCTVTVTGGGAGGIQVAGSGTLTGESLTVTSASKAAIRSDRGGGTILLNGGIYTSTGKNGCPAIYSTADITVQNAECVSEQSRAVIIEGKNSVTAENCTLTGNDQSTKEGSIRANVFAVSERVRRCRRRNQCIHHDRRRTGLPFRGHVLVYKHGQHCKPEERQHDAVRYGYADNRLGRPVG